MLQQSQRSRNQAKSHRSLPSGAALLSCKETSLMGATKLFFVFGTKQSTWILPASSNGPYVIRKRQINSWTLPTFTTMFKILWISVVFWGDFPPALPIKYVDSEYIMVDCYRAVLPQRYFWTRSCRLLPAKSIWSLHFVSFAGVLCFPGQCVWLYVE